ncbi:MAG: hypothetical protein N838_33335 [Thiohalocapsa sp. PB-PSB1]|mgnify:CR=1 FL=1|nr:MAG: hypothetical protein N838_31530 [Thiohalocapsa sp. PB-PSB1]QQO57512.1 MAG: hypothetical protein N838_33335 [Thiohalocapsa sp. PB-PSB1]
MEVFNLVVGSVGSLAAILTIAHFITKHLAPEAKRVPKPLAAKEKRERIVLDYNPKNVGVQGTFENKIQEFESSLSGLFQGYNPHIFLSQANSYYLTSLVYTTLFYSLAIVLLPFYISTAMTPFLLVAGTVSLIAAIKIKRNLEILRSYVDYLETNKIFYSCEFTQDREVYEQSNS